MNNRTVERRFPDIDLRVAGTNISIKKSLVPVNAETDCRYTMARIVKHADAELVIELGDDKDFYKLMYYANRVFLPRSKYTGINMNLMGNYKLQQARGNTLMFKLIRLINFADK